MELEIPCCSSLEFDFNSGRTSPCDSSPSTPRGFGGGDDYFFSAPTSPMIRGGVEGYGDYLGGGGGCNGYGLYATNTKSKSPLNAQKFYEEGDNNSPLLPPQSPNNSTNINHKKKFWSPFSPKRKKEPLNDETTMNNNNNNNNKETTRTKQGRQLHHRESSVLGRQVTRSLSPLRVSRYPWEEEEKEHNSTQNDSISNPPSSPTLSSLPTTPSSKGGNNTKKWRLKDLLLFRSASEGRALDNKDPWKKHLYMMQWKHNTSSISQSRKGSSSISSAISPHEVHYMVNKAKSQDMKKKSFLPYKQGILGRLAINPTVHALAHGFGSLAHT